jgi:hypothetical protein
MDFVTVITLPSLVPGNLDRIQKLRFLFDTMRVDVDLEKSDGIELPRRIKVGYGLRKSAYHFAFSVRYDYRPIQKLRF